MSPFDSALVAVGWGAARTIPVAWLVPSFGTRHVPAQVRLVLGAALAVLCLPRLMGHVPSASSGLWILLLAREVMVGATLGLAASLVFRAAESAGTARGSGSRGELGRGDVTIGR